MNSIVPFDDRRRGASSSSLRIPAQPQRKSFVHQAALWLVWVTIASSSLVFAEPGPVDILTVALIVTLPAIGLTRFVPGLGPPLCLLLVLCATGIFATTLATDVVGSLKHNVITIYLCAAALMFAAFVACKPQQHTKLILNAYLVAALIASVAGIAGILELVPGAGQLFTKFGRASGTFKDPNVFGPFLIPALVYAIHLFLTRPLKIMLPALLVIGVLSTALLLSLSRGAWFGASVAVGLYLYFFFVLARRDVDRLKVAGIGLLGLISVVGLIATVSQTHDLGTLLADRASLTQSYDVGVEGRFGGQAKALELIQDHPFGIGALEFLEAGHHHENAHNTYLTLFLSNGWLGGFAFVILALATLALGLRHILKRNTAQPLFLVIFVSLVALLVQAMLVDLDHWRQFFLLLGVAWGMMASNVNDVPERKKRIVRDRRPNLLRPVITIGPTRRPNRIVRRLPRRIELPDRQAPHIKDRTHGRIVVLKAANDPGTELVRKFRNQRKLKPPLAD